jgi:hypothetical protein
MKILGQSLNEDRTSDGMGMKIRTRKRKNLDNHSIWYLSKHIED